MTLHYTHQASIIMLSPKQTEKFIEENLEIELENKIGENKLNVNFDRRILDDEEGLRSYKNKVYVLDSLVEKRPKLFPEFKNTSPPDSSLYAWIPVVYNSVNDKYKIQPSVKFGECGSHSETERGPTKTVYDYKKANNHDLIYPIIVWVASHSEIVDEAVKQLEGEEKEIKEKIGNSAIEIENGVKRSLDEVPAYSGTEHYGNTIGEIIQKIGDYTGNQYMDALRYEMRAYIKENDEKYKKFLKKLGNVDDLDDPRKKTYVLAAATGLGKTAMSLKMLLDFSNYNFPSGSPSDGSLHTFLLSSMPKTLRNFLRSSREFNIFYNPDGEPKIKIYTIGTSEKYLNEKPVRIDGDEVYIDIEGGVEEFIKSKKRNEEGIHILTATIQDFKRKYEQVNLEDKKQNTVGIEKENVINLIEEYEELEDFYFDVLLFDEAHHATNTEKTKKAIEQFEWGHRIFITATPEDYVTEGNYSELFWLTRKEVYERKRNGEEYLQGRPDYNYRLIKIREAVTHALEKYGHDPKDSITLRKLFALENDDLKRERELITFIKDFLDIGRKELPVNRRRFSVYKDNKTNLCSYSKKVGLFSVPSGNSEKLCGILTNKMNKESNENYLFLNVYENEIEDLDRRIENQVLDENGKYERAIIFTHNIHLTGFDRDWIGWILLARNIQSSKLWEQATGRPGREGPAEKTNCAVYFAGLNGFFDVINRKYEALRRYREDPPNYREYTKSFRDAFNVMLPKYIESGKVKWEKMNHQNWTAYLQENLPSDEKSLAKKVINEKDLESSSFTPNSNIPDSEDGENGLPVGGREGDETPGTNTDESSASGSDDDEDGENEDEEENNESDLRRVENIIEDFIFESKILIEHGEFQGSDFESFIKSDYYKFGGKRFKFEEWFETLGHGSYTQDDIVKMYDENILNTKLFSTWFQSLRPKKL